ncbi:MAG: hypothetical protein ACFFAS_07200 [Promethearchaeota archaeon]
MPENIITTPDAIIELPIDSSDLHRIIVPGDEIFLSTKFRVLYSSPSYRIRWKSHMLFSRKGLYLYTLGSEETEEETKAVFVSWKNVKTLDNEVIGLYITLGGVFRYSHYRLERIDENETSLQFMERKKILINLAYQYFIQGLKDELNHILNNKDNKEIYTSKKEKKLRKKIPKIEKRHASFLNRTDKIIERNKAQKNEVS